jgi:hypothetical protein
MVDPFAVSVTLAESCGIEVEVEGDDSNDESLQAVATTVTPTHQANARSFFGREVNEVGRLALVGGCCNKDGEGLLDTYTTKETSTCSFPTRMNQMRNRRKSQRGMGTDFGRNIRHR